MSREDETAPSQILPLFESWWTEYAADLDRDSHWYQGEYDAARAAFEAGYAAASTAVKEIP